MHAHRRWCYWRPFARWWRLELMSLWMHTRWSLQGFRAHVRSCICSIYSVVAYSDLTNKNERASTIRVHNAVVKFPSNSWLRRIHNYLYLYTVYEDSTYPLQLIHQVNGPKVSISCMPNPHKHSLANSWASSVGTALRCFRSDLFPTRIIQMFGSAWSFSSFSHFCTFSNVGCLAISYTTRAPTAPL